MPGTITAHPAEKTATFKIHSNGAVKAITRKNASTGADEYFVEGIASSNVRDRHGDTMTTQAQAQMLDQAKGLTMFLNHSYDVPEDVFGTCEESGLETHGDIVDLVIRCRVAQTNPRAMKSWQLIQQDEITLGFSIGGNLTEYSVDEENDDGNSWCPPLVIDGIELFEISLCGVPANPRSYTRDFVSQISRGFMRSAARSPEVRELVRKTLLHNGKPDLDIAKLLEATNAVGVAPPRSSVIAKEAINPSAENPLDGATYARHIVATYDTEGATDVTVTTTVPQGFDQAAFRAQFDAEIVAINTGVTYVLNLEENAPANALTLAVPEGFDVDAFRKAWDEALANGDAPNVAIGEQYLLQLQADASDARAKLAEVRGELRTKVSERDALLAEIATLTTQRDATRTQCEELVKTLAEIKATPTGRQTKTATSVGSSGETAILGVDLTKMTNRELLDFKRKLARGELAVDGRSLAQ